MKTMYIADAVQRFNTATTALGVTVGLLLIMVKLVDSQPVELSIEKVTVIPPINNQREESQVKIEKPELTEVLPIPDTPKDNYKVDIPTFESSLPGPSSIVRGPTDITKLSIGAGIKLTPVSPVYPPRAITQGLCGKVIVQFDISTSGTTSNIQIVESSNRVFEKNTLRAVAKYRYKPAEEGGKAVQVLGKQELISYKLEEGCTKY